MPHDVVQAYLSADLSANVMSYARAKFCPSSCDVAACSALPSGISASIEYVSSRRQSVRSALFSPR